MDHIHRWGQAGGHSSELVRLHTHHHHILLYSNKKQNGLNKRKQGNVKYEKHLFF
jgi:hypothetical protein